MEEYNALILGVSPSKASAKKGEDPDRMDKVKVYVEDLTVMREQLLKVEFKNIELEDINAKLEREA
jgi:hypothetical protein